MASPLFNASNSLNSLHHLPEGQATGSSSTLASTVESASNIANRGGPVNLNQTLKGVFAKVQRAAQQCALYVKEHPMLSLLTITGALVGIAISCVIPPAVPMILVGAGLGFGVGKGLEKLNRRPADTADSNTMFSSNRRARNNGTPYSSSSSNQTSSLEDVEVDNLTPSEDTSPQHAPAANHRFAIEDHSFENFFSGLEAWKNAAAEGENRTEATERILFARAENDTTLNLESLGLKSLPAEIGQLKQLQSLGLFDNQLTNLPPVIGQLTQLQELWLNNNQFTSLPPEIGLLTQLQRLGLSKNQFTTLPPEIGLLTQLQRLGLSKNQFTTLPPEIGLLTQLQRLGLNYNQFTSLPPEIGQLTQLKALELDDNQLTSLPPEIGQLKQLRRLMLNRNQLSSLPPEIGQLAQLQMLYLGNNRLSNLPPEIGQLTQLQGLGLNCNQLTSLPPEIGQLTQLQNLWLNYNQFTGLPREMEQLMQLLNLWLNYNQFTSMPPVIGQLTQLQGLGLSDNQLTSLPQEIGQLTQLQRLSLRANRALTQLPESLDTLQNLQWLDLNWCSNLSALPAGFERLPAGATVCATGTGLSPNVLEALDRTIEQEQVNSGGQRGPRMQVSLPAAVTRPVQSLGKEMMSWFEEANQQPQFTQAILKNRLSQLPTEEISLTSAEALDALSAPQPKNQTEALATLLMRLRKTGHYTRAKSDMQQRVCNLLNGMIEHKEVLQTAGMMAFEGIQTCDDRTALSMLIMELDLVQHQAVQHAIKEQHAPNSPERRAMFQSLLKLGQGVFKESKLMDIAHKQAKAATGIVDETEIVLKYITHLSQDLDLPVKWSHMLYEQCANIVTTEHINQAKSDLKDAATLDNPEFLSFLSTWQPLHGLFETFEPEALDQIKAGIEELEATRLSKQEALDEALERAITTHGEQSPEALNLLAAMNTNAKMVEEHTPVLWRKAVERVIGE